MALLAAGPFVAGIVWMLQTGASLPDALFGGAIAGIAIQVALLLLAPVLAFLVIPVLAAVAIAGVLLQAVATGFMSGLRSAATARRSIDPAHE